MWLLLTSVKIACISLEADEGLHLNMLCTALEQEYECLIGGQLVSALITRCNECLRYIDAAPEHADSIDNASLVKISETRFQLADTAAPLQK
jgi:hypothetical protein